MCFTLESALSLVSPTPAIQKILQQRFAHKLSLYATRHDIGPMGTQVMIDSGGCLVFADDASRDEAVAVSRAMNVCHFWADWAPTVAELRDGRRSGVLVSASAAVQDALGQSLLVQRDRAAVIEPGKWQCPGMRVHTVDAVKAAHQALSDELALRHLRTGLDLDASEYRGQVSDDQRETVTVYVDGRVNHQHQALAFLDQTCNTLEQFVTIRLPDVATWYEPRDRVFGRTVGFMDGDDLAARASELAMNLRFMRDELNGKTPLLATG